MKEADILYKKNRNEARTDLIKFCRQSIVRLMEKGYKERIDLGENLYRVDRSQHGDVDPIPLSQYVLVDSKLKLVSLVWSSRGESEEISPDDVPFERYGEFKLIEIAEILEKAQNSIVASTHLG